MHSDRRAALALAIGTLAPWPAAAQKLSLSAPLTEADAENGLRIAIERAAITAADLMGRVNAFMGNPRLRIPLPGSLDEAARLLLAKGQRRLVGELSTAMNRAAEAAMPEAKPVLVAAVKWMSVADALAVLKGGERAATSYFEHHARSVITEQFVPIVRRAAERMQLAQKYDSFAAAARAASPVAPNAEDAKLAPFVARKALDSLFVVIGDIETRIRIDPAGTTGNAFVARVFNAVK